MLWSKSSRKENLVVRGARVLDPVAGIDEVLDVRVDCGVVAQLGADLDTNEHHVLNGQSLLLAPAFVDPHVHLRTPGREDEEVLAEMSDYDPGATNAPNAPNAPKAQSAPGGPSAPNA